MCLVYLIIVADEKNHLITKVACNVNFIFLIVQFYFFFFR